ncbi:MAG: thioredoxin family protein [Kiritimatiellae bacterium]|nr:thioredoxin family protein [Kiritimatiellia bacterium]
MKNRYPLIVAGMLMLAVHAQAAGEGWIQDFEKAKQLAREKNLPILADFSGSDWCGWCMRLDREVFSRADWQQWAKKNVVLFVADFPANTEQPRELADQNKRLMQTYEVKGFPTVLLLDAGGKVMARTGYRQGGPAAYVAHVESLLKAVQAD